MLAKVIVDRIQLQFGEISRIMHISKGVNIVYTNEEKLICKMVETSNDMSNEKEKVQYIDFLYNSGIFVSRIKDFFLVENQICEIQEYVEHKKQSIFCEEQAIAFLAKYHALSQDYDSESFQKTILNLPVYLGEVQLPRILLGTYEKFLLYPIEEMRTFLTSVINENSRLIINELIQFTEESYFIVDSSNSKCICHNDISCDNLLLTTQEEKYCLIDFDYATASRAYFDVIEVVFPRSFNEEQIIEKVKNKILLERLIQIYNISNARIALRRDVLLRALALKLISYWFCVKKYFISIDGNIEYMLNVIKFIVSETT